ncbi:hypothetical protein E3E36_10465 [Thermococcus sp. M36]|uniref:hypothetical protein n=1 Tax=Thermococcus sp. M36 TaxID=1638261 RepID=UPI00143B4F32|nr:hypothetical protein [Thermococcus sp. M36]NJE06550.1 hypothetical protein [Thermococcus sp. M36]
MKKTYLGLLIVLMVFAAGCISGGGTSSETTTTSQNLPFTPEDLNSAIAKMKSYEYTMEITSYNGTKPAARLITRGEVDIENGLKAVATVSNSSLRGPLYYRTYYYTTKKGYATLTDRNGTITWEAACYSPGEGPNLTVNIVESLWKVLTLPDVKVEEEGEYYIVRANTTGGTIAAGEDVSGAYKVQMTIKLTKELMPAEVNETVHYTKNGERWVDIITLRIDSINRAKVEPPKELLSYLKRQGVDLSELLSKC